MKPKQYQSECRHFAFGKGCLTICALLLIFSVSSKAQAQGQWTTPDANNNISSTNTGNVGIDTANPNVKLEVNGLIRSTDAYGLSLGNDVNRNRIQTTTSSLFQFLTNINGAANINTGGVAITNSYPVTPPSNGLYVQGNVGVGTTAPTAKLDVNGDANITGTINATGTITGGNIVAKYQDVAEWVPSTKALAAATVVVLDSTQSNFVTASSHAYDTKVAGVISERPGIALGESGAGKVLVATTGRVKVKVDASRSTIHVGDLLVTSNVEGLAMKSEPLSLGGVEIHRPGTLIGKALEPLVKGTGEILVLLSLQ